MPLVDRDYRQACLHGHVGFLNVVSEGGSVISKSCQECGFTPECALVYDDLPLFGRDSEDLNLLENPARGGYRISVGKRVKMAERPCRKSLARSFKNMREVISYHLICLIEKFHGYLLSQL